MFLYGGQKYLETAEPPKLVPSKENLPPHPNLIQSVQGGPRGSAHRVTVCLCPRFAQQQNNVPVEESDYVSNSPSDCHVWTVLY